MLRTSFFSSNETFEKEFSRCCIQYQQVEIYSAWVGDPKNLIPYDSLKLISNLKIVVGTSFSQSHPDGIRYLMEISTDMRIAKEKKLFHPKVYIFSNETDKAVFIGSSNLTYQGFCRNQEVNILMEGNILGKEFLDFEKELSLWRTDEMSFVPDKAWLKKYAERYQKRREKIRKAGLEDEAEKEEEYNTTAWLANANWDFYIAEIKKGLQATGPFKKKLAQRLEFFILVSEQLPIPWTIEYFDDIEKRRIIGGMDPYGWLGHVAASGDFRRMMKNGTTHEKATVVNSINQIAGLSRSPDLKLVKSIIEELVLLGPTMKVWGRLLALVRPDMFCTISAPEVRSNISNVLGESESYFETVEGYLRLITIIHGSPWYQSEPPSQPEELEIWKRRAAFLDIIFY